MGTEKYIVIYADNVERFRFFSRFVIPLSSLGDKVHFVTAKFSVFKEAQKRGFPITLFTRNSSEKISNIIDTQRSLSVLNGYHTACEAEIIASQIYQNLAILHRKIAIKAFFIWNGTTTIARSIASFAKEKNIALRFFEISNLGDRIFVDIEGTSADSYVYRHPELLDKLSCHEEMYHRWLKDYQEQYHTPKQALNRSKIPWKSLLDLVGYLFFNTVREDKRFGLKVFITRFLNKIRTFSFPEAVLQKPYAFLPLQVSDDSQIKLFSEYDNKALLFEAMKICRSRDLELVVKLHPAESDRAFIREIVSLSEKYSFRLAGNQTDRLIQGADLIIVNNSTVGLEAKIYQKEVIVFGKAIYKNFDEKKLKRYICSYLVKADYFADTPVPLETMQKILSRNRMKV
jgi:capsular polysaccharide export protein